MARGVKQAAECSADRCVTRPYSLGLCVKHWTRFKKYGSTEKTKTPTLGLSPWGKVQFYGWTVTANGCWEFNGPKDEDRYGVLGGTRRTKAHRVSYEQHVGPIPKGSLIRHYVCDNPPCINPEHLRPGTIADNMADRVRVGGYTSRVSQEGRSEMVRLRAEGALLNDIAAAFGVSASRVSQILKEMAS